MTVEAAFPNADSALSPGMFGSAQIRLPTTEQAVFVPLDAIVAIANGESSAVYAIVEGNAQLRVVQTGEALGDAVRIVAGLNAGTVVATTQLDQLFDGAPVRTTVAAAPPQADFIDVAP
jgi:membrane fusion protein (multidrug efflux system)